MSLLQMTLAGGAMVLAVVLARALLLNRLPKATFIVLWALVAVRLLVPVSIPSPWSAASLLQGIAPAPAATSEAEPTYDARSAQSELSSDVPAPLGSSTTTINAPETSPVLSPTTPKDASTASAAQNPAASGATPTTTVPSTSNPPSIDSSQAENPWNFEAFSAALPVVWVVGSALCAGGFALVYLRCRRDFATSLPVDDPRAQAWLAEHRGQLRRPLSLRQSDLISTPLTYGVVHPVILVPRDTDWSREGEVRYVLAHELVHVRRFDALTKLVLMACACVHWFNPLVWAMYVLANRDLELSCDERVVRGFGTGSRADYARTLIAMEETKSGLAPLYSGFSKTATEERIVAIMHIKKTSLLALAASASLVVGIPAALATSALPQRDIPQTDSDQPAVTVPLAAASSYDTSAWDTVVSSTHYSADDWALVEALNVPGVEDLTVAEFTDLALEVADTPEKLDTLLLFMDDPDIAAQASTNGAANFVANVVTPVLRENSRFPVTASYGGATEAHWTGVTTLVSTDAVVGDGEEEALPLLGNALTEAGYGGGEMCYAINAHVLDADAVTVGEYVQTIADTRHAVDDLVGWDLTPTWDRDAGEKLTVALEDISQNQSSDSLLVEASWFFVDGTDGGVTLSDTRETNDDRDATAALLATYVPLGLSYSEEVSAGGEPVLTMEFAGSPVRSVYDEHLGVWIANSMNEFRYGDEGVDLVVVYDGDQAVGLRASSEQEQGKLDSQRAAVTVALEPVDDGVPVAFVGSAQEFDALNASYEPFDLVYDETTETYYYKSSPVRYLFDGYVIEMNADGTAGSYVTANEQYNANGTVDVFVVREAERGADGSVNYMGDVTGVKEFSQEHKELVDGLIEGYTMRGLNQVTAVQGDALETAEGLEPQVDTAGPATSSFAVEAATSEGDASATGGLTIAGRMKPFEKYGLTYRDGNLFYGNDPVNAFVDMSDSGVFSYNSNDQYTNGLYLRAVYDANGKLTGLKEFDPGTAFVEE